MQSHTGPRLATPDTEMSEMADHYTTSPPFCSQHCREHIERWKSRLGKRMDSIEARGGYPSALYSALDATYDKLFDFLDEATAG
jgi:hypothetical protein